MGIDDYIEIILLIIFFIVSPLIQRWRRSQAGGEAPETSGPSTGWPAQGPQAAVPDYSVYLAQNLRELSANARRIHAAAGQSPLLELPHLAPVAERLVARAQAEADAVQRLVVQAVGDGKPSAGRALQMSRAIEEARRPLARAKAAHELLQELTTQRTDPRTFQLLHLLDRLLEQMTSGPSTAEARRRFAFFYDGDPMLLAELVGPGAAGLVPLRRRALERAAGWSELARGAGFDLLGQYPDAVAELRELAMVGPLAGRRASPPFFAGAVIDMAAAVGAWTPNLAADTLGTLLLGRAYALGVVLQALRERVDTISTVTISTGGGRYHHEPPLLVRLALIDAVLDLEGRTEAENGVGALRNRLEVPNEGRYVLPNGLTQRLLLDPLTSYTRDLAQAWYASRVPGLGDRRLIELLAPPPGALERARVQAAERAFLDAHAHAHAQAGATLLAGAILAEHEDAEGRSYTQPLIRALVAPPAARRRRRTVPVGAVPDRALLRDALVLSEIL